MILPEYLSTFFLAETPSEGWPRNFHIITAYNPGIILGAELNAKADEELRKEQNLAGSRCFRITGCSPDLKHREEGCGVAGLTDEEALSMGRKYGQNAIFSVTDGILSVIGCLSGEKIKVDSWEKRILSDEESKNPNHPFPKKGRNTCLVQEQPQFSLDTTDNLKSLKK